MVSSIVTITLNPALDKTVTVEHFQQGGLNRVKDARIDPGGKGINVARVLRQFNTPVTATGFIAGLPGRQLLDQITEQGIVADFCTLPGEMRINMKVYDEAAKVTTEINEPGFQVTSADLQRIKEKLFTLLADAEVLVIGGSLPQGAPESLYREYIDMANEQGVKTILDADGAAFLEGIKAQPDVVKPNQYELEQAVGKQLHSLHDTVLAARDLLERSGVKLVVVSMGGNGAIAITQAEGYYAKPFPITPQSTVGAGDSMVAALAYSLQAGWTVSETIRWATAAGTVTAAKSGTQVCTLAEVQQSLNRVEIKNLKEGILT
ncbi:1-phosphofructokinase [Brevibacillus humidisoli]|uniref:1-phosphofructokinase n=1 Tax=Brevibacillus humidisoli TaxID=2895522 RepID=UPI001E5DDF8E|nr:1-phosphofructokinase [Brevibacillus humidisoli]UFJ42654.1 1-phosphofructokinase [Brevibacillus humidisoli]